MHWWLPESSLGANFLRSKDVVAADGSRKAEFAPFETLNPPRIENRFSTDLSI
jgi:hypothetical protein